MLRFHECITVTLAGLLWALEEASIFSQSQMGLQEVGAPGPDTAQYLVCFPKVGPQVLFHPNLKTMLGKGQDPQHCPLPRRAL